MLRRITIYSEHAYQTHILPLLLWGRLLQQQESRKAKRPASWFTCSDDGLPFEQRGWIWKSPSFDCDNDCSLRHLSLNTTIYQVLQQGYAQPSLRYCVYYTLYCGSLW